MRHTIETLDINGIPYTINTYYERRRSVRASIGKNSINIRIPSSLSKEEQYRHLTKIKNWIQKRVQRHPERFKPKPQKEYKDGDLLKIGEEDYLVKINFKEKKSSSGKIKNNTIHLTLSNQLPKEKQNEHISHLIARSIASKRINTLKEKIHTLNNRHFNQRINKIFFKNNTSNWGSCSTKRNINISTRLLFAPDSVLEYVCIHELAHLIEHNHSPNFWELVENVMPDYKEKVQWLKNNGHTCEF